MAKTVSFTDVYQANISIGMVNNLPDSFNIVYGLVDSDGVRWNAKSYSASYASLGPNIRAKIDALIVSANNVAKAQEGL